MTPPKGRTKAAQAEDPASVLRGPEPEPPEDVLATDVEAAGQLPSAPERNGHLPKFDLGKTMRMNIPAPTAFCNLIYPSKMHTLSGPPEAGKTMLALWLAVQAMKRGHNVLMIDEETGDRQIADLLRSMGADPEMIDKQFWYMPFLDLPWKGDDIKNLRDLVTEFKPKLSIFDSAGEILAAAGIDENSPSDVTRFYKTVLRPLSVRFHSSVLLLDHDAKDGDRGGRAPSRYSRGTTAKLASPDVAIKLVSLRPFSRVQDGIIGLTVVKDRPGALHRYWRLRVSSSPLDVEMSQTTMADEGDSGGGGMSPAAEKLFAVVNETPSTQQDLVQRVVDKYGHGLRRETASRMLGMLADQGLIDRMELGPGRPALWVKRGGRLEDQVIAEVPPPPEEPGGGWPAGSVGEQMNL